MRAKLVPFALLSGAAVASLPAIYALVRPDLDSTARLFAVYLGLVSMGLAWAAGASLEDRRRNSVTFVCALGVLSPLLAVAPAARDLLGPLFAWLLAMGALSLVGVALLWTRWRSPPV